MPAVGGEPALVTHVDDRSLDLYPLGFATDADRFYLIVSEFESDIYVMDLAW